MLIDGEMRNRLVSLADPVEETRVDLILEAVLHGAAVRRRRVLTARLALAGTALTLIVGGTVVGWGWQGDEQVDPQPIDQVEPQPIDQVDPIEREIEPPRPRRVQPSSEKVGRRGIRAPGDAGSAPRRRAEREVDAEVPASRRAERRAGAPEVTDAAHEVAPQQKEEAPVEEPVRYQVTHRESASYEGSNHQLQEGAPIGCYRYTCREFESSAEDRFAMVTVNDRSGPVVVRILQTGSYGVHKQTIYCGGSTERFELVEDLAFFRVEVHNGEVQHGDCGTRESSGGDIEVTFFK